MNDVVHIMTRALAHQVRLNYCVSCGICPQIFDTGFVHADPHPGNLFVRPKPSQPSQPQLVLLDHGMYITESSDFRRRYAQLWQAMVLTDLPTIKDICIRLAATRSSPFVYSYEQLGHSRLRAVRHVPDDEAVRAAQGAPLARRA